MRQRRKKRKLACTYKDHPTWYGKTWHFLWHEDTMLSFFTDAILIILIGKFIFFPVLGVALATDLPAVAVLSSSMDHNDQSFDTWWANRENQYGTFNITESEFSEYDYTDGFSKGDVLIVHGQASYLAGDVIVYHTPARANPIIHRVVLVDGEYQTKGDANSGQIGFEKSIDIDQISGKAVFKIPYLGWPKVWLMELFN